MSVVKTSNRPPRIGALAWFSSPGPFGSKRSWLPCVRTAGGGSQGNLLGQAAPDAMKFRARGTWGRNPPFTEAGTPRTTVQK